MPEITTYLRVDAELHHGHLSRNYRLHLIAVLKSFPSCKNKARKDCGDRPAKDQK